MQEEPRRRGEGSGVTVQQLCWSVLHFMSLRWPSRVARASVSLTVKPMILQASLPFFFFWCKTPLSLGYKVPRGPMRHVGNE